MLLKPTLNILYQVLDQKQVLPQSQPSLGESATSTIENTNSKWQVDLLQFAFSGQDDEETDADDETKKRYALLCINVFNRELLGVTLVNKSAETVIVRMRQILKNQEMT